MTNDLVRLQATPKQTEKAFQSAIVQLAKLCGWEPYYVRRSDGSPPGWPDLVLIRGGKILYRELKTEIGQLTSKQAETLILLRIAGQDADLWRPSQWPEIEATLKGEP